MLNSDTTHVMPMQQYKPCTDEVTGGGNRGGAEPGGPVLLISIPYHTLSNTTIPYHTLATPRSNNGNQQQLAGFGSKKKW